MEYMTQEDFNQFRDLIPGNIDLYKVADGTMLGEFIFQEKHGFIEVYGDWDGFTLIPPKDLGRAKTLNGLIKRNYK